MHREYVDNRDVPLGPAVRQRIQAAASFKPGEYAEVLKAQRIIFISAFANITPNDNGYLSKLLDRDLQFWRRVLQNTDTLIAKMIAVCPIEVELQHVQLESSPLVIFPKVREVEWVNGIPSL